MKAWEWFVAYYDGDFYCAECVPGGADLEEVTPVFASDEVSSPPRCHTCGTEHAYMSIIGEEAS